ncbi:hypothetical protein GLYMA_02G188000v4 [Glycine max]|nr:hypothetical protein GLYMA_02G188000v4 [Glycine max]KAH1061025.1 hypothetical protein GYH30_004494 [Glycine max]
MLEITTKMPKILLSPTAGGESESPRCHASPVLLEELISNILHRVPVRSLLQFKCVCKSWNSLISDPLFAKDHLCASTADPNMTHQRLLSFTVCDPKIVSFPMHLLLQNPPTPAKPLCSSSLNDSYLILGSCNGLLCLYHIPRCYVALWNPSIRFTSKRLPTGLSPGEGFSTFHGFGYDAVNDKYKLLLAMRVLGETVTKIYTFGADSSCKVIQNLPLDPHPTERLGKFVSGTLNWIAPKMGVSDEKWVICSFDFATETSGQVVLPYGDRDNVCKPVINAVRNCLCVCFFDSRKAHWAVWLMKEYGVQDSWTKLMVIPRFVQEDSWPWKLIPHDELCTCRGFPALEPLCISGNGLSNSRGECAIWLVIWSAVIFCVWKLRNDAIFRQESVDKKKLVEDIKFVSWSWLNSLHSDFNASFVQWSFKTAFCLQVFFVRDTNCKARSISVGSLHFQVLVLGILGNKVNGFIGARCWYVKLTFMHMESREVCILRCLISCVQF